VTGTKYQCFEGSNTTDHNKWEEGASALDIDSTIPSPPQNTGVSSALSAGLAELRCRLAGAVIINSFKPQTLALFHAEPRLPRCASGGSISEGPV